MAYGVIDVEKIVFCSGFSYSIPEYFDGLKDKFEFNNNKLVINKDYSLQWKNREGNKVFIQNAASHSHGINDPNLSLASWRSASIINSILGYEHYSLDDKSFLFNQKDYSKEENSKEEKYEKECSVKECFNGSLKLSDHRSIVNGYSTGFDDW